MVKIIERVAERYDVHEVEFGRTYVWCPQSVLIECECGERSTFKKSDLLNLNESRSTCECGKDSMDGIREEIQDEKEMVVGHLFEDEDDEVVHPWRYWHTSEDRALPF